MSELDPDELQKAASSPTLEEDIAALPLGHDEKARLAAREWLEQQGLAQTNLMDAQMQASVTMRSFVHAAERVKPKGWSVYRYMAASKAQQERAQTSHWTDKARYTLILPVGAPPRSGRPIVYELAFPNGTKEELVWTPVLLDPRMYWTDSPFGYDVLRRFTLMGATRTMGAELAQKLRILSLDAVA